ncbi:unnamed protein product [Heligmosomoides polygyrus]|uniref:Uncharacterized protein n=1 Tax=Heligmosomoides polygyrus TaxID=6339 RepID=A0A3P7ZQE5_HELPZ|nr:unnamed protein product [Heligmosomoides polygyrus]
MANVCIFRDGGRLEEYDEFWPVRWARHRVYEKPENTVLFHFLKFSTMMFQIIMCLRRTVRFIACVLLSILCYLVLFSICCIPCCYHYTCRRHSFYHRHKCSRTFIRCCSHVFHYTVFFLSLLGAISLVILNLILLSSVHILGSNSLAPEIDRVSFLLLLAESLERVCITLLPTSRSIHAAILPSPVFSVQSLEQNVNDAFLPSDNKASTVCKPLWEDGGLNLGFRRKEAGPWQTRRQFGDRLIVRDLTYSDLTLLVSPQWFLNLLWTSGQVKNCRKSYHFSALR